MADGGMMYSSVSKLGAIIQSRLVVVFSLPWMDSCPTFLVREEAVRTDSLAIRRATLMPRPGKNSQHPEHGRGVYNPDWMPYFHLQHDDYITLKERCTAHIASGAFRRPGGYCVSDPDRLLRVIALRSWRRQAFAMISKRGMR